MNNVGLKKMQVKSKNTKSNSAKNGLKKPFVITFLACALSLSGYSGAAWMINGGEPTAIASMTAALQMVTKAITSQYERVRLIFNAQMVAMDSAVSTSVQVQNDRIRSSLKVLTKQMSVSSQMIGENMVKNAQTEVSLEQANAMKERILETNENYGTAGNGHKVCTVLAEREATVAANSQSKLNISKNVGETVYAAPGSFSNSQKAMQEINLAHADYCTQAEADSGYCSKSDKAGWDVQASTLFIPTTPKADVYTAQNGLINNMVGLPDEPLDKSLSGSPLASNYLVLKQRKDTIISPAINSLKSIQNEYAATDGTDNLAISPIQAEQEQVQRYLGNTDEYQKWNQTLTSSSEHGVMKEILQVQALDLHLQAKKYHQNEREELLLAGLVAANQQMIDSKTTQGAKGYLSSPEAQKAKLAAKKIVNAYNFD